MADGDGFVFKVNRVPFQTDYLTPSQTVECGDNDGKFHRVTLHNLKKLLQLLFIVEAGLKLFFSGTLNAVGRIAVNQPRFVRILQCFADVRMTVDDRVCRHTIVLHFISIVILNMLRFHIAQLQAGMHSVKIGNDPALDRHGISCVGHFLDAALHHIQPVGKEDREKHLRGFVLRALLLFLQLLLKLRFHFHSGFLKQCFRPLFIALHRQACCLGRGLSFSVFISIAKDDMIISSPFTQMACYHKYPPFDVARFHPPLTPLL